MEGQPFRILSLDGGGIMGAFAASALAALEDATDRRVVEHFDLITGTSTGGIIAIGLAMGASAAEICRFYKEDGPKIFPARKGISEWYWRTRSLIKPAFMSGELKKAILKVVGDRPLKEAQTRLVIPSYDVNTGKIVVFKTPHHPWYTKYCNLPAVDVALATAAAPTYFPAHTIDKWGMFIDGGLWANCPAMVGVVEVLDFLGQAPRHVRMLSVSTTSYPFRIEKPDQLRGLLGWAPKLKDTFMFGQAQAAENMARCLLRSGVFHRIDYVVPPKTYQLDNVGCVRELIPMGRQVAYYHQHLQIVQEIFLNGNKVEPFRPLSELRGSDGVDMKELYPDVTSR
jgi:hypothetical protein